MLNRHLLVLSLILIPVLAHGDALDGLAVLYNLYSGIAIVIALIGFILLFAARHRRILIGVWAGICMLVGFPTLSLIADWGLQEEFIGPLLCFMIGFVLAASLLANKNKDEVEEQQDV